LSTRASISQEAIEALPYIHGTLTPRFRSYFLLTPQGILIREIPLAFVSPTALGLVRARRFANLVNPITQEPLPRIRLWVDPEDVLADAPRIVPDLARRREAIQSQTFKSAIDILELQNLTDQIFTAVENAWIAPYRRKRIVEKLALLPVEARGYEKMPRIRVRRLEVQTNPTELISLPLPSLQAWYSTLIDHVNQNTYGLQVSAADPGNFNGLLKPARALLQGTYTTKARPAIYFDFENKIWYGASKDLREAGGNYDLMQLNQTAYAELLLIASNAPSEITVQRLEAQPTPLELETLETLRAQIVAR
jgi:hypothetical protein